MNNNEIEFRVWDTEKKMMVAENDPDFLKSLKVSTSAVKADARYELQLYTNKKDKNGKKIYSGDLFSLTTYDYIGLVVLEEGTWVGKSNVEDETEKTWLGMVSSDIIEVVGNIYEHQGIWDSSKANKTKSRQRDKPKPHEIPTMKQLVAELRKYDANNEVIGRCEQALQDGTSLSYLIDRCIDEIARYDVNNRFVRAESFWNEIGENMGSWS